MKGKRLRLYKRIASIVLCFAMLLAYMPVTAYAAEGTCGDNATWSYDDSTKTLTISGKGAMTDYANLSDRPWDSCVASIERIEIEPGVTSIGESAFYGCTILKDVSIPNSVTSIGFTAFSGCTSLESISIPAGVTSIGEHAFSNCANLTSVTIPNSVTSIGEYAFSGCTSLASVSIPNSVTSIGAGAFYNCTSLTSVRIEDSVESIGRNAFSGCTSLTSVSIPNSVTSIGESAFMSCTGLTTVDLGDGMTSIGRYAFSGCTSLTSVTIPNSVTSIGEGAFADCTGLTEIEIPNSVESIGKNAFSGCTSLENVYYLGTNEEWDTITKESGNEILNSIMESENGHFCSLRIADGQTHTWSCSVCNETVKTEPHDFSNGKCVCGEKKTPTAADFVFAPPEDLYYTATNKEATFEVEEGITGMGAITYIKYYRDGIEYDANAVGSYTVQIHVAEGENYKSADFLRSDAWSFDINYLSNDAEATISGEPGTNGWYVNNVTLSAPDEFTIAKGIYDEQGNYSEYTGSVMYDSEINETVTYYLKDVDGHILEPKTIALKIDKTAPEVQYKIDEDAWKQFVNTVSFGIFSKDSKTLEINATDATSGVQKIEYYVANEEMSDTELDSVTWNVYSEVLNLDTGKYIIYVRVTDNAGNVTEKGISTEGIVIYEDSSVTSTATREYKAGTDLEVSYASNGNILDKVVYNNQVLEEGSDYTVDTDAEEVTFTSVWLDNYLDAGTHEITFVFNPQGVDTEAEALNKTLTLTITPVEIFIVDATATSRDYDGTKDVAITGLTLSRVKETDNVGVSFNNLTGTISSANVGNYTRVTFEELSKFVTLTGADKDNYKLVYESGTEIGTNVTISKATATVVTAPIVNTLTFTDRAQALVKAGVTNDGTLIYSLSENGEYTSNIPTATEVGDYTVWYYVKGDTNHTDSAKASVKVIIKEGPHIENEEGKMGWDAILDEVEDVIESDTQHTVTVDMNGTTVVPGDVLENIKGKDVTVEFDLGDGIVWTVNGKEITATDIEDIDFAVTISTEENSLDTIPVEVLNQVTGQKSHMEISLAHDGEFGFTAVLSLNLEAKNAGLYANLYYYNPTTQAMEFICSDEIAADGTADLTFTHASDYTIVIDEVAADAEEQEGSANQGGSVTPGGVQAPQTGDVSNVTLWTLLLMAGLGMLVFVQKKYVR